MTLFKLPDLGEGLKESEIIEWHVQVGDEVRRGDPLVSVETEKAAVDIPAPETGRILKLFAEPGDVVETGEALVEYAGEAPVDDSGTVVGRVESSDETLHEEASPVSPKSTASVRATPAVRALARKLEVDLGVVSASGPEGTITRADVERAAERLETLGPSERLRGVRRVMAVKMAQSGAEVVPATVTDDADIDHWPADADITVRLLQAVAAACAGEPALNAWFDSRQVGRRLIDQVDIAIALDTEEGLFTPVIRDVANRDEKSLKQGLEQLKADVRDRSIPPEEMRGYSITLSNFGMIAGRYATPVVVPPCVAIVGAGRVDARPIVVDDRIEAHRILPLSLTFDHRAVTGGEAARFLQAMIKSLSIA